MSANDADLQLVYQGDRIDYARLPDNRIHADMTSQELISTMKVFSLDNLYSLSEVLSLIVARKRFLKKYADRIINARCSMM